MAESWSNSGECANMVALAINIPAPAIRDLCQRRGIRRLALFGSVLGNRFGPSSDVDVLVEFHPGRTPGLALIDIEDDLSALFGGRRVDLVTEKFLNRRIRQGILDSAVVIYEG